jgi:hypothetical protein
MVGFTSKAIIAFSWFCAGERGIENLGSPQNPFRMLAQVFGFDHPIHGNREVAYGQGPKWANSG